jgi:hypothetical protein
VRKKLHTQRAIKKTLADSADFTDLFFIFLRNPRNPREKKLHTQRTIKKSLADSADVADFFIIFSA